MILTSAESNNKTLRNTPSKHQKKVPKRCSNQFQFTWGSNSLMWYCPCGWTLEVLGGRKGRILTVKMSCAEWCHHIISKLWSNKYIYTVSCQHYVWMCNDSDLTQLISVRVGIPFIAADQGVIRGMLEIFYLPAVGPKIGGVQPYWHASRNTVLHEERVYGSFLRIAADITQSIWTQI